MRYLCELPPDRGVDPSAQGNHAIRAAASHGQLDSVRYLCELPRDRGVDPSAGDNHAIRAAASHGQLDIVRYLCELPPDRGVDPQACHITTFPCLLKSQSQVVRYLSYLPGMPPRTAATSMYTVPEMTTSTALERWELDNCYDSMTVRRMARQPVLALCAVIGGPHHRGGRLSPGRVGSSV